MEQQPFFPNSRLALARLARDLAVKVASVPGDFDAQPGRPPKTDLWHLHQMCSVVMAESGRWPLDKLGRWLGYVQGVLAARGLMDVDAERDRTRGGFRSAYVADGLEAPAPADAGDR